MTCSYETARDRHQSAPNAQTGWQWAAREKAGALDSGFYCSLLA